MYFDCKWNCIPHEQRIKEMLFDDESSKSWSFWKQWLLLYPTKEAESWIARRGAPSPIIDFLIWGTSPITNPTIYTREECTRQSMTQNISTGQQGSMNFVLHVEKLNSYFNYMLFIHILWMYIHSDPVLISTMNSRSCASETCKKHPSIKDTWHRVFFHWS